METLLRVNLWLDYIAEEEKKNPDPYDTFGEV